MKVADFIGKEANHIHYGKVFVKSAPKGSKAMVDIIVTQRGKGWNEATQKYERFKLPSVPNEEGGFNLRWKFTNNDEYGIEERVHIKELNL